VTRAAPRTADDIAAQLLALWQTEHGSAEPPRELLVSRGSDAWMWARALAFVLQGLDAQAAQNARDILPDQCSDEAVARFGNVYGVGRLAARGATLTAEVAGPPLSIVTIPAGSLLTWTDGTLYACESPTVTINGAGVGSITVAATTYGAGTTRDAGDALTWQSAPAGLGAFATVTAVVADGRDTETFAQWAQRILARLRLRLRPAAGTREQWRAWALAFQGYDSREAWVYPLLRPPTSAPGGGTAGCVGCLTVLLAGPPQGDSTVNSRVLGGTPGGRLDAVAGFINGTVNALGQPVSGEQLRPVAQPDDGWTIEAINETSPINVTLSVRPSTAAAFSFTFAEAPVDPASTATSLVLTGDYASGATDLTGRAVLVNVGTGNVRGGFLRVVLPAGVYSAGSTTFDLTATPLPGAPQAPFYAYPCPGAWGALRLAVFRYFDALSPGVATSNVDPTPLPRWPDEDAGGLARMSISALSGVVGDVPGVVAAGVIAPTDDVVPSRKQVVTLGRLLAVRPT